MSRVEEEERAINEARWLLADLAAPESDARSIRQWRRQARDILLRYPGPSRTRRIFKTKRAQEVTS